MCESISCSESSEITLHSWMGARGALVGTRVVWRGAAAAARADTFSHLFKARSARRWPLLREARWGPLRSIQFGVRKMDGFLPKDTEFMSLEGFLVNRGEKWERVKMKTKWEEKQFMRPHAYMQRERDREIQTTAGWMWVFTVYSQPDEILCSGAC